MIKFLIPIDKANHFFYGFIIFMLSSLFFNNLISFLIVCAIALIKEVIYDKLLKKGTPDYLDFIASISPALLIVIKSILF